MMMMMMMSHPCGCSTAAVSAVGVTLFLPPPLSLSRLQTFPPRRCAHRGGITAGEGLAVMSTDVRSLHRGRSALVPAAVAQQ